MSRLVQADKRGVKITILYGKDEISFDLKSKLKKLKNLNLYFLKHLHAKCYFNESIALLGSMNLYEFSQVNNWEIGVFLDENDTILKEQLLNEINLMLDNATSKIKNFKESDVIKESSGTVLSEFLNSHFRTNKFKYKKVYDEMAERYDDYIISFGHPKKYLNIEITKEGTRIDFELNLSKSETEKLGSSIDLNYFNDEYRVYQNSMDLISMYCSIYHRDKWNSYSEEFRSEYIIKGIEKMINYLEKLRNNNNA